jgi:23S rRNA pseudouridine1911/1915/1917 synthase
MNLEILFEDDDLLVINKPAGIPVIPDRFQADAPSINKLLEEKKQQKIWVVHRLDRDTSGVLCFAKNEAAHRYMSKVFQETRGGQILCGPGTWPPATGIRNDRSGYYRTSCG